MNGSSFHTKLFSKVHLDEITQKFNHEIKDLVTRILKCFSIPNCWFLLARNDNMPIEKQEAVFVVYNFFCISFKHILSLKVYMGIYDKF